MQQIVGPDASTGKQTGQYFGWLEEDTQQRLTMMA